MAMLKDRNVPRMSQGWETRGACRALAEGMEAGETFTDFLDAAALVSDADQFEGKPGVTLITLHSTKGLGIRSRVPHGHGRRHLPLTAGPYRRKRNRMRNGASFTWG